ncbi:MAG: hypothetical protein IJX30_04830 [Clostridia bacterium]|nr:hypothetical protein [Clostridia bacterium]
MMKKLLSAVLAYILILCMSVSLVGCQDAGLLPNGNYAFTGAVYTFVYIDADIKDTYGWVIEGDTAEQWVSGSCNYKAKIVERDGEIRFDGYKWRDLLDILFRDGKRQGSNHDYIVVYNEAERSITLTPVDISSED